MNKNVSKYQNGHHVTVCLLSGIMIKHFTFSVNQMTADTKYKENEKYQ